MDAGTHHASAGAHAPEGRGYQSAHRREQDRGIEPLAGALVGAAGPLRAELASEALAGGISGTSEGEHLDALRTRHLSEEMSRGAEAVEAEPARLAHRLTEAREAVSAIADEPRAKKRGELRGRPFGGERQAVALVGEHLLGVTAVPRVPGEARPLAQILAARAAIEAFAAGEGEPRHPHAIADAELAGLRAERRDGADDLVARRHRKGNCRQLAIEEMQVRAADATGLHPDQQLVSARGRQAHLSEHERRARAHETHRFHGCGALVRCGGPMPLRRRVSPAPSSRLAREAPEEPLHRR